MPAACCLLLVAYSRLLWPSHNCRIPSWQPSSSCFPSFSYTTSTTANFSTPSYQPGPRLGRQKVQLVHFRIHLSRTLSRSSGKDLMLTSTSAALGYNPPVFPSTRSVELAASRQFLVDAFYTLNNYRTFGPSEAITATSKNSWLGYGDNLTNPLHIGL